MGGCQNYGSFLGTLNIRCRIIIGIQKGTNILTIAHIIPYITAFKELRLGSLYKEHQSSTFRASSLAIQAALGFRIFGLRVLEGLGFRGSLGFWGSGQFRVQGSG